MNGRPKSAVVNRVMTARQNFAIPAYRHDVQGLRALAVIFVVLYHFDVPFFNGGFIGVDVFFVISGFVITRALLAELNRTGRVALLPFWARRARRLMPASVVTLVLSVAIGALILPRLYLESLLRDATAVALYVPNILFAQDELNYLADASPSILKHYWSLGVEEQFYLIWPLLMGGAFLLARASRKRLFAALCVVTALSLVASVVLTSQVQPWAFFSMPTRVWEFGAGGLVAFYSPALVSRKRALGPPVGWIAILALIASAIAFNERLAYPGFAAVLPVAATAVLILVGDTDSRSSPARILSWRPMLFVGSISYSLYLVHWPIIVLAQQAGGVNRSVGGLETAALVALSVILAWLLYLLVERRLIVDRSSPVRSKATLAIAIAGAVTLALVATSLAGAVSGSGIDSGKSVVASSAGGGPEFTEFVPNNLKPSLRAATADVPKIYNNGCHLDFLAQVAKPCYFGSRDAKTSVELFGDSHAAQWFPALQALALAGEIYLRVDTKSSCPSVEIQQLLNGIEYQQCDAWREDVISQVRSASPDLILLSNYGDYYSAAASDPDAWKDGVRKSLESLAETSRVLVVADTPHFPFEPPLCLSAHVDNSLACGEAPALALNAEVASSEIAAINESGSKYLDLNSKLCSDLLCGPVIGATLVYRDAHHMTATMAATFAPDLRAAIAAALSHN